MTRVRIHPSKLSSFCLVICAAMLFCVWAANSGAEEVPGEEIDALSDLSDDSGRTEGVETTQPVDLLGGADSAEGSVRRSGPAPPVGVRHGEPLEVDQIRVAYRFVRTQSQGLLIGDQDIRPERVRNSLFIDYEQSPRSLEVTTHVFEVAYAPHPRVTLVAEVPFIQKELERFGACGEVARACEDQTEGVGDIGFAVLIPFIKKGVESSHLHLGLDVPTGSFRRNRDGRRLPYDSQIGNGTVDLEWGWTYRGDLEWVSWGAQAVGRHPVGRNGLQYREGSRFEASLWSALRIVSGVSASLRFGWEKRNNLSGQDSQFQPVTDVSENGKARGGTTFTAFPGLAVEIPQLDDQRLAVEFGIPVYQDLDGPQLERDWSATVGWQWAF